MALGEAAALFTKLTIGDGLVSQVPAFLISLGRRLAGHAEHARDATCPSEFVRQLFSRPAGAGRGGRVPGHAGLHQPAATPAACCSAAAASALAMMLVAATRPSEDGRRPSKKAEAAKPAEERVEDYLADRSDGGRDRRRADPAGRSQARRRPAGADPARSGRTWPPRSASSCPRSASATTCGSTRTSTASRSPTCRWPTGTVYPDMFLAMDSGVTTGKVPGIADARTRRSARRPLWIEPQRPRPGGDATATRWSSRAACWPRT